MKAKRKTTDATKLRKLRAAIRGILRHAKAIDRVADKEDWRSGYRTGLYAALEKIYATGACRRPRR